jgi:hypothetical protein
MIFGGFISSFLNTNYFWLGGSMNRAVVRGTWVASWVGVACGSVAGASRVPSLTSIASSVSLSLLSSQSFAVLYLWLHTPKRLRSTDFPPCFLFSNSRAFGVFVHSRHDWRVGARRHPFHPPSPKLPSRILK